MSTSAIYSGIPTEAKEEGTLQRGLKRRHMNMIAIGGAIGTGLFVASGAAFSTGGAGWTLVAFVLMSAIAYFLMKSLGEMATQMPVAEASAPYATHFVDPALGFALGWNYWYCWALSVAVTVLSSALVLRYWFPGVPAEVWSAACLLLLFAMNFFSTEEAGEGEFWFAGIKVIALVVFILTGALMAAGAFEGEHRSVLLNWTEGFAPLFGNPLALSTVFLIAGLSFKGTELFGTAIGDCENPAKDVPRAIKAVFRRIFVFYIGSILVVGSLIPYFDPHLLRLGMDDFSISPFTLVFARANMPAAAAIMNFVILAALLSCGNSALRASTRMLQTIAKEGYAPAFFLKTNARGVAVTALPSTLAVAAVAVIASAAFGEGNAFKWILTVSGVTGLIAWIGIAVSHLGFRRAWSAQGKSPRELKYAAKWYPFGPILTLVVCLLVVAVQYVYAFVSGDLSPEAICIAYGGLPLFLALYLGRKVVKGTKVVDPAKASFNSDKP